jgi:hypothetical protein
MLPKTATDPATLAIAKMFLDEIRDMTNLHLRVGQCRNGLSQHLPAHEDVRFSGRWQIDGR